MIFKGKKSVRLAMASVMAILGILGAYGCQPVQPDEITPYSTFIAQSSETQISFTQPGSESNVLLNQWLAGRETPLLIIHNDAIGPADLTLLDTAKAVTFSLNLPLNSRISNLNNSLSPNQEYLALLEQVPGDPTKRSLLIYDLLQAAIIQRINIAIPTGFDPAQVFSQLPEAEQTALKARNLGSWVIQDSLGLSLGTFRWSRDSQSLFFANYCNNGFACLFRYNLDSDRTIQLETEAGYFDAIHLSPNGSQLMLVKTVVPQLTDFPITHPMILDQDGNATTLLPAETLVNVPSQYAWLSNNAITRTYFDLERMQYQSLEIIDMQSNQIELLTSDHFIDYIFLDDALYMLAPAGNEGQTLVHGLLSDKPWKSITIDDRCSKLGSSSLDGYLVNINCENGMYGISADLEVTLLLQVSANYSFSPGSQYLVTYAFAGLESMQPDLSVYDSSFSLLCKIPSQNVRQVTWHPRLQSFLYLNPQGLYRVSLQECNPHLLLNNTSDDYRHMDALWYSPLYTQQP